MGLILGFKTVLWKIYLVVGDRNSDCIGFLIIYTEIVFNSVIWAEFPHFPSIPMTSWLANHNIWKSPCPEWLVLSQSCQNQSCRVEENHLWMLFLVSKAGILVCVVWLFLVMVKYLLYSVGICKAAGWVRVLVCASGPKQSKTTSVEIKHSTSASLLSNFKTNWADPALDQTRASWTWYS